jgi:hypothetical protein
MDSVSNSCFEILMNGLSVNVKGNGAGGHQWDNRSILASSNSEIACVFVRFDVKLCEEV